MALRRTGSLMQCPPCSVLLRRRCDHSNTAAVGNSRYCSARPLVPALSVGSDSPVTDIDTTELRYLWKAGDVDYDKSIETLTAWAQNCENVRAMVMTGSAAAHETHPLSDRDIEVYATNPEPLLADDSWWDRLGDVLVVERLTIPGWHPARLVYYVGGKLDLTVIRADNLPATRYERPFTVLVDKDDLSGSLHLAAAGTALPNEAAFQEQLNWGYAAALMCAKAIVRDEPWSSKIRDRDLKAALLTVIEWDHLVRYGRDHDVRFLGAQMRQWMDGDVQQALEQCWGHFGSTDSTNALRASIALFARLGSRIADGLDFQPFNHDRVHDEVEAILALRPDES